MADAGERGVVAGSGGLAVGVFQGAGVGGDVDRVPPERGKRDDLQRAFVRRRQHDRCGYPVLVGVSLVSAMHTLPTAPDPAR